MKTPPSEHKSMINAIKKELHSLEITRKMLKRDADMIKAGKVLTFIDKEIVLAAYREYYYECAEYK